MRVLHLPTSVGGNAWGLAQGEKALGLHSHVLAKSETYLSYPADIKLHLDTTHSKAIKLLKSLIAFARIRNKYDIFHFNFGETLINIPQLNWYHIDLPLYPRNAKLFVTYNGCDARQKYLTMVRTSIAACHEHTCYSGVCNSGERDVHRRNMINNMDQYVHHMWAVNPDLLRFLPRNKSSFLPYSICHYREEPVFSSFQGPLHIVHAPTNRAAKGSKYVVDAIMKLQRKYPTNLKVTLVENVPHSEALNIYRSADIVIDQILIGWYGAFAVETMLMGKPLVARIAVEDLKFIPKQMASEVLDTVINADPSTIYSVLEKCLHDRKFLKERSLASFDYARRWHHPKYIAGLTKAAYEYSYI